MPVYVADTPPPRFDEAAEGAAIAVMLASDDPTSGAAADFAIDGVLPARSAATSGQDRRTLVDVFGEAVLRAAGLNLPVRPDRPDVILMPMWKRIASALCGRPFQERRSTHPAEALRPE